MPTDQQILTLEQIAPLESAADKWIKGLKRTSRVNKELIASIPALCQTVRAAWAENERGIELIKEWAAKYGDEDGISQVLEMLAAEMEKSR